MPAAASQTARRGAGPPVIYHINYPQFERRRKEHDIMIESDYLIEVWQCVDDVDVFPYCSNNKVYIRITCSVYMASYQGICSVTQRCPARLVVAATASRRKSCWTRRGRCSSGFFRSTGTSSNCRGLRSAPGRPEVRGV